MLPSRVRAPCWLHPLDRPRWLEVTLYEGNRDVGKVFLSPGERPDRRRLARLEKFRIALTEEKLVVNFVVGGS